MSDNSLIPLQVPGCTKQLHLYVHGAKDQFVSKRIRQEGLWEPYETALVQLLLQPGDVFVDVGANIGYFSVLAAHLVGGAGQVFAFEPDPHNFDLLRANAHLNNFEDIIHAVCGGLAEAPGGGRLYLSEDNLGDHQIYAGDGVRESLDITLYRGSDYLQSRLQTIDLLKVDTQGSEYQVMSGLMPLLQALAVMPRVLIELTPFSLRCAGSSGRALIELLAQLQQDFWIVDHIEHRLVASSAEDLALWCDNVEAEIGDRGFMNILVGREI